MHGIAEPPVTLQGDLANLPAAFEPLKALPNWVCWKWVWRVDKNGEGQWTKPPFRPQGGYAKNTDPATWCSYAEAVAAWKAGGYNGIGFCLRGTDLNMFDIDDCRDPVTGSIAPEAMEIVNRAKSYTEVTPSGTGLRVTGTGSGAPLHRKQKLPGSIVHVESYRNAARYVTVTGNPLPGTRPDMADIGSVVDAVVAELDGKPNGSGNGKADGPHDFRSELDKWIEANRNRYVSDDDYRNIDDTYLPPRLKAILANTPQAEDRSGAFHHAVCWLHFGLKWSARKIDSYIDGKPVVPQRYEGRLRQEIYRCLYNSEMRKAREQERPKGDARTENATDGQPFEVFRHGEAHADELVSWLVKDLIFENGTGLASGQWGTAKTFTVLDLAGSVMTGTPFAGREVARKGGVLFVAAEGSNQIPIRLKALVEAKLRPAGEASGQPIASRLPYSWIKDCPNLQDDDEFDRLVVTATREAELIFEQFNLPLVLIVIDTLSATGNFKDANDAAEGQRVMNRLAELSQKTGAFVLAVDHFGKAAEAGTRGSTAKEAAADIVLAMLGDREINGTVSNLRMALRKLRGGQVGAETPFSLRVVDMGEDNSSCVVEWQEPAKEQAKPAERWPKSLRIFKTALVTVLVGQATKAMRLGESEEPKVQATPLDAVRYEFTTTYPADAEDPRAQAETKRKAFNRALKEARNGGLIGSREIDGIDYLWLVEPDTDTTGGKK
jgi:hypothetical protein